MNHWLNHCLLFIYNYLIFRQFLITSTPHLLSYGFSAHSSNYSKTKCSSGMCTWFKWEAGPWVSNVAPHKSSLLREVQKKKALCAHILLEQRTEEVLSCSCSRGLFIVTIWFSLTPKRAFRAGFSEPHQVRPSKLLSAQRWESDNSLAQIRAQTKKDPWIEVVPHTVCVYGWVCMCGWVCVPVHVPCIYLRRWWVRIRPTGDHITTEIATIT